MKRRFLFVFSIAATLIAGAVAFSSYTKGKAQTQPHNPKVTVPEHSPLSETTRYKHLFIHHLLLDKKADDEEKLGKDAKVYREFYKRQAKLTDAQAKDFDQIAKETSKEFSRITAQAQEAIKAIRARYPEGKVPIGQKPPTPPAILADLQEQHDVAIEQGRDKLKQALGETDFAKFDDFVRRVVGADVKTDLKINRVPPTSQREVPKK